ncbi:MAG: SRPBCC family protein [Acetobacteraceae bacterium]
MAIVDEIALALELSRRFDAPPERLFQAWLGAEWGAWLPPFGATCEVVALDAAPGGRYRIRMAMPDGRRIEISGKYREIDRPRRLVLDWTGSYNNQETVITVTFRPDGAGTLMTLQQTGFVDVALCDGYRKGWSAPGGSLDKLAACLAGRSV